MISKPLKIFVWRDFIQILPRFRGVFTLMAHSFSRAPGAFPHADTLACGEQRAVRRRAREGGEEGAGRAAMGRAGQGAAHADTLAGGWRAGRGGAAGEKGWQCRQAPWGRGEGRAREGKGKAARGGSGKGGRQKNSEKSSAGRLATGPRIAYLCSRGEEAAMARPAPATKKAPMPHAPRRPAGRGGHGGRTINPTTRSYASRKTLRKAEGEE